MSDLRQNNRLELLFNALAPLKAYLDDPDVQEIMINGPDDVFIERRGVMHAVQDKLSNIQIESAIQILSKMGNKETKANTSDCLLNEEWPGVRVAATLPPVTAIPTMSIRKHNNLVLSLDDFVGAGSITPEMKDFLVDIIKSRKNILIAGGTSSGKTTFFNALLRELDPNERIFTIEDVRELRIMVKNWVSLKTNKQLGVSARTCVEHALRYRPDRVLLGEVRDAVAFDLLTAANTGHDGCLATLHANSATEALARMEILCMQASGDIPHRAVKEMIALTFQYVLYMERRGGKRELCEVLQVSGFDTKNETYVTKSLMKEPRNESQIAVA